MEKKKKMTKKNTVKMDKYPEQTISGAVFATETSAKDLKNLDAVKSLSPFNQRLALMIHTAHPERRFGSKLDRFTFNLSRVGNVGVILAVNSDNLNAVWKLERHLATGLITLTYFNDAGEPILEQGPFGWGSAKGYGTAARQVLAESEKLWGIQAIQPETTSQPKAAARKADKTSTKSKKKEKGLDDQVEVEGGGEFEEEESEGMA